jgi:hypothetical protein
MLKKGRKIISAPWKLLKPIPEDEPLDLRNVGLPSKGDTK